LDILDRLTKVKKTSRTDYVAVCPAHDDKSPSLAIRLMDDGRTLIHCFGGCDTQSILESLDLEIDDLFPEKLSKSHHPLKRKITATQAMEIIYHETLIVYHSKNKEHLTPDEQARLRSAYFRISEAMNYYRD